MKRIRTNEGITLISLIITIVIIAILAAVTIGSIRNVDIIGRAKEAANEFERTQEREEQLLKEYESLLKDTPETMNTNFYGPVISEGSNSEGWFIVTQDDIRFVFIQVEDEVNNEITSVSIIGTSYRTITLEDALSLLPESEKQTYIDLAEQLKTEVGEIDSVLLCYNPSDNQEIFGGVFLNNNNNVYINADIGISFDDITIDKNDSPSELLKKALYKNKADSVVYVKENSESSTIINVKYDDNILVFDYESQMIAMFGYTKENSLVYGYILPYKISENDEELTVKIDGDPKVITEEFKKIDIVDIYSPMYMDKTENEIYKSREYTVGGISDGDDAIILLRKDYDIEKLGFVVQ